MASVWLSCGCTVQGVQAQEGAEHPTPWHQPGTQHQWKRLRVQEKCANTITEQRSWGPAGHEGLCGPAGIALC